MKMNDIKSIIKQRHSDKDGSDESQLDAIFSEDKRIMVEAPAGYGKTRTLISKIAYLISSKQLKYPKKILALSFSVSASYNMKKEILEGLPQFNLFALNDVKDLKKYIYTTNYHGFCRRILFLYGYLLDENLKKDLKGVGDLYKDIENINKTSNANIDYRSRQKIINFGKYVQNSEFSHILENKEEYLETIKNELLPNGYITYNSILLFTLKLFDEYPKILDYYQKYYSIIVIDEFQDTNILNNRILDKLICEDTQLIFMGDSLQRIYGFIGALPNLIEKSIEKFNMVQYSLKNNYRFQNIELNKLDNYLRNLFECIINSKEITLDKPNIEIYSNENQQKEADTIIEIVNSILDKNPEEKIAVLVRSRNENTETILRKFKESDINYFNSLFDETHSNYTAVHDIILYIANEFFEKSPVFTLNVGNNIIKTFKKRYDDKLHYPLVKTLLKLFESFLQTLFDEYSFLTQDEKIKFLHDTLNNKSLNKFVKRIDNNVILSTIHGAKGLEWENVILADIEKEKFPFYKVCGKCDYNIDCNIKENNVPNIIKNEFLEDFSVFYVGCTRPRKNLFITYSDDNKSKISCFLKMIV